MQVYSVTGGSQVWQVRSAGRSAVSPVRPVGGPLTQPRRDVVSISPQARTHQMIAALNEQKQGVVEQRTALISKTLEKGESLDTIEAQLDAFNEKMQTLDESIATLQANQAQVLTETLKNQQKTQEKEAETEEEQQASEADRLTGMASQIDKAKVLHSTAAQIENKASIKHGQIVNDKDRVRIRNAAPGDNAAGTQYIADKRAKLSAIRAQATAVYKHFASTIEEASKPVQQTPVAKKPLPSQEEQQAENTPPEEQRTESLHATA